MANSIFPGDSDRPVLQNITFQASRLHRRASLPGLTADDIEQELLLDLLCRASSFEPSKASFPTFADRIVAHRLADLSRPSARLKAERSTVPIDERVDATGLPLVEILPDRAPPIDMAVGLRIDLARFTSGLPPHLARCFMAIDADSVGDAARTEGVHRSTFHDRVQALRTAAARAGLGTYLNHPDISTTPSVCGQEDNLAMKALPNMTYATIDRGHIPLQPRELALWIAGAAAGEMLAYYRGRLAFDTTPDAIDPAPAARKLRAVARLMWSEQDRGRVLLVQRRLGDGDYLYIAVRSSRDCGGRS